MPGVAVVTWAGRGFGLEIAKRERSSERDSAIIWSASRMLSATEVAEGVVGLLDSKRLVLTIPGWRGGVVRSTALLGRHALLSTELLRRQGERRRSRS